MGQASGLDAMHGEFVEGETSAPVNRLAHIALANMRPADPIAEGTALTDAAANVGQGDAAQQFVVIAAENEKAVAAILFPILVIARQAPAEGAFGQHVTRPCWLPRLQKITAFRAQLRPGGPIAARRRPQKGARQGNALSVFAG